MVRLPILLLLALVIAPRALAVGESCGTVSPDSREECCQNKVNDNTQDDWCQQNYPELNSPPLGSSCGTVSPDSREECCQNKANDDTQDDWCQQNYPDLYSPPGSSCGTVSPDSREECCQTKANDGTQDDWCQQNYPDLNSPPLGSSCGTVSPDSREECCLTKLNDNTQDDWCQQNYPDLYNSKDNTADYPWMALVSGPSADCAGSLIAPGYVLTAAQCVYNGSAAAPEDVSVWVGGKWHNVATVLVNQDNAQFQDFDNSKSEPSWDIAMLALEEDSDADYVALPTSDVPAMGSWVTQTAWKVPARTVETAQVNVWDGCPADFLWADQICVGGGGYLQACPDDKGAPLLQSNTQVGLASGPGCDGTADDYGAFVKLADKGVLEQITVWLNSREGTDNSGLDDNVRAWLQEANTYLYGRR
ncbi:hypothetical protein ABPG77_009840 [Micractinium sp. CCAP 211/92]